jgi:hypothetical protein
MQYINDQILNISPLATTTSISVNLLHYFLCSVQFVWTGTPTGTVSLQESNDNINWSPIAGASQATGGSAGNVSIDITNISAGYIQAVYTHVSGAGTVTAQLNAKGN